MTAENENIIESDGPIEIENSEASEVDTDATDSAAESPVEPQPDSKGTRTVRRLIPVLLAVLLLGSAVFAGASYYFWYRADQRTNTASADVVLKAASDGAVAMLSYAPETMDKDFANAKSHLTNLPPLPPQPPTPGAPTKGFLDYYTDFTKTVVTPAVKQKSVKTQATIARAAVSELHQDSAMVLAFINQITVSKENPDGSFAASAVKISMRDVNGKWLISAFDPV
jgi:Mce-associated membrane protein